MKNKSVLLCLIVILGIGLWYISGFTPAQTGPLQTELDRMLAEKWQIYGSDKPNWGGGLALYIISPKGNYYASANMPGGTENTHFRAASTTKTYTAAAIMLLHQQGKLDINDLITANIPGRNEPYIPNTADYAIPNKGQITIKLLLCHRAGVFDLGNTVIPSTESAPYAGQDYASYIMKQPGNAGHTFNFDELVGVVARHKLSYFAPDTSFEYSNTGYSMLGKIIERVSGKRYDQFMRNNFLIPNGLARTSFPYLGSDRNIPKPYETGYAYHEGQLVEVSADNMSSNVAEGNLITTPLELAQWIRALIRGQSGVSSDTVKLMMESTKSGKYGLGIFKIPGLGYGHNGGHNGYVTTAFCDPKQDVTVIMSASGLNWDDIGSELRFEYDTSRAAKNILGYSTAEAN